MMNNYFNRSRKRWEGIVSALMLLAYFVVIVTLSAFHEFWIDELHVWEMDVNLSVWQVIATMAREGHFATWHLIVMPFAKSGISSVWGLPLVSIALMMAGAWFFIYKSDFSVVAKFSVLFSLPFVYLFAVICRVYALIPLVLWAVAWYYPLRMTQPWKYGLALGILFNTHLYMAGLGLALLATWICEAMEKKIDRRRIMVGIASSIALGVLAFAQIAGNFFLEESEAGAVLSTPHWLMVDFPDRYVSLAVVSIRHFCTAPVSEILSLLALALLLAWYTYIMRKSRKALLIVVIGITYQVLFALYIYLFNIQRFYLPFCILVFGFWIGGLCRKKSVSCFLAAMFLLNVNVEYAAIKSDIDTTYEIYNDVRDMYDADTNDLKLVRKAAISVDIMLSCYGADDPGDMAFSSEDEIYGLINEYRPHVFSIYDSCAEDETQLLDYDVVAAHLREMGYDVDISCLPFLKAPGCFCILEGRRPE